MQVKDVMTKYAISISSDSTVKLAAETMQQNDIGDLPVNDGGVLEGMLTDRDIVIRCVAKGCDPAETPVSEIMTDRLYTCFEDQDILDAAYLMKEKKIRRVVVLNRNEQAVGVVSLSDIAAHGAVKLAAETLEAVAEPVHSK
jgi:CBS domain-containing protein